MSANVEGMVREGIAAFKEGRKEEARALLSKAVELDQYNEQGWMWLSGCVDAPDDQRICLENVLAINPMNERARKGLAYLEGQNVDFNKPKPVPPPAPEMPTSVEWEAPTDTGTGSSPAFTPASAPISDEEYDNWVTGLNLPTGTGSATPTPPPAPAATNDIAGGTAPFADLKFDDDLFADGPFKAPDLSAPPPSSSASPMGQPSSKSEPPKRRGFEFGRAAVLSTGEADSAKTDKPKRTTREERQTARDEKRAAARAEKEKRRTEELSFESGAPDDLFIPEPAARDYTLTDDLDADHDEQMLEDGEGELFGVIPKEIKATRLPGTREGYPVVGLIMLIALIALNVGALGVLVLQVMNAL